MFAKELLFSWRLFSSTVNIQMETSSSDVTKTLMNFIKEHLQPLSKTFPETTKNLQRNSREKCYTKAEHISYSSLVIFQPVSSLKAGLFLIVSGLPCENARTEDFRAEDGQRRLKAMPSKVGAEHFTGHHHWASEQARGSRHQQLEEKVRDIPRCAEVLEVFQSQVLIQSKLANFLSGKPSPRRHCFMLFSLLCPFAEVHVPSFLALTLTRLSAAVSSLFQTQETCVSGSVK